MSRADPSSCRGGLQWWARCRIAKKKTASDTEKQGRDLILMNATVATETQFARTGIEGC